MKGTDIVSSFKKKFGKKLLESKIEQNGKIKYDVVWMKIPKKEIVPAIQQLFTFGTPHFAVISANDYPDKIELVYELSVGWGEKAGEILVNIKTDLAKKDLKIHSICELIPGALISEKEKQELFGVKIVNIPDNRNFFLPQDFKGHPGIKKDKRVDMLEVE